MMQRPTQADEMQRELHATLSAMREVGPAYEDHLVESFVQKFSQQLIVQMQQQTPPKDSPSAGQRLALAIVSLSLLFPMSIAIISILSNTSFSAAFAALCLLTLAVVGINFIFNRSR
jgi:hypothetical protein